MIPQCCLSDSEFRTNPATTYIRSLVYEVTEPFFLGLFFAIPCLLVTPCVPVCLEYVEGYAGVLHSFHLSVKEISDGDPLA